MIVTSYLFENGELSPDRLEAMTNTVGKDRLVIDISCRRRSDGSYYVATNRWQTVTETRLNTALFAFLEPYCAEFLIHAADVEGRCEGIDEELGASSRRMGVPADNLRRRGQAFRGYCPRGALSGGRVDLTIGSALDIFGGSLVRYDEAAAGWGGMIERAQQAAPLHIWRQGGESVRVQ